MTDAFVAEIRVFPFNFAPKGWATCNGQILPISQNTALFSLLGTTYGGDGRTNFALPNLQGASPLQPGQGPGLSLRDLGETGGSPTVTLLQTEMPAHNHIARANNGDGSLPSPGGTAWSGPGADRDLFWYNDGPPNTTLNPAALSVAGSGLPHNNLMPYLTLNFCIAMQGIFPQRS